MVHSQLSTTCAFLLLFQCGRYQNPLLKNAIKIQWEETTDILLLINFFVFLLMGEENMISHIVCMCCSFR